MTDIRTVHITNAWHPYSGGVRTFYDALLTRAAADRRQLSVVVPGEADETVHFSDCTRLHTIRAPRSPILDRRYRLLLPNRYVWPDRGAIWRVIGDERPDLIEVSDKFALCHLAGLIKRRGPNRPTLVGLSHERFDDGLQAHVGRARPVAAFASWYIGSVYLRQFDAHIANSHYTAAEILDVIARRGPGRPAHWRMKNRVHVAPLGVDAERFRPSRRSLTVRHWLLRLTGGDSSSVLVLYAGRLSAEKHVGWLVPAVKSLVDRGVDARLVVVGGGPLGDDLRKAAAHALPRRFATMGHVNDRAEFASMVASADLFLHPNPREPFGLGPLEAMASGVPVVVPMQGGVLSYATHANAWLADPSPDGLATAAFSAIARHADRRQRCVRALETARALTWPRVAARYLRLYSQIHAERLARDPEPSHAHDYRRTSTPLTNS